MKIILSHDVDHINWCEHFFRDLFIPKYLLRHTLSFLRGKITGRLFYKRLADICNGRMNRLEDLMKFDSIHGIPATYFIGVNSALGMSYPQDSAKKIISFVLENGFDAGVHGVAYNNYEDIKKEYEKFKNMVDADYVFGVRNHYLRRTEQTLKFQEEVGYIFDSTEYELKTPYIFGKICEIPISLMDAGFLPEKSFDLEVFQKETLNILSEAANKGLPYFVVNTHDIYFSELFPDIKKWYQWFIGYLTDHYEFTDFTSAVRELRAGLND